MQKDWGYRISVTRSNPAHIAQDALRLTLDAQKKGLAFCYIIEMGYTPLLSGLKNTQAYKRMTNYLLGIN